jgi:hypothetical protein
MKMEGFPPHVFPATRHSRAGGNPGLFCAQIGLDTRFRGYDGTLRLLSLFRVFHSIDHPRTRICKGGREEPNAAEPQPKDERKFNHKERKDHKKKMESGFSNPPWMTWKSFTQGA